MEKIYLINGLIFQHGHVFYSIDEMSGIGDAVKMQTALMYASFIGVISNKVSDPTQLVGVANDRWGEAIITDFVITDKKITFTKKYRDRKDLIYMSLLIKKKISGSGPIQVMPLGKAEVTAW
jgi:hypothetical protein